MSNSIKCPFFKNVQSSSEGITRFCHLISRSPLCSGEIEQCEHPDLLKITISELNKKETLDRPPVKAPKTESFYKVLVVDDEEHMRKLLDSLLSSRGHQCITARNGVEALEKLGEHLFDMVITDIRMPEMDGITFTRECLKRYPGMPVIAITGHSKEYSTESIMEAGARDFIEKPFSIDSFILRLNKVMKDHEILSQIETRQKQLFSELHRISADKIEALTQEIEDLKSRLDSRPIIPV